MDDFDASTVFENMPTVGELFRIFPISFHTVLLIGVGYWVGRKSLIRLIDYLEKHRD